MSLISRTGRGAVLDIISSRYNLGYLVVIDEEHYKIHRGEHFVVQDYEEEVDAGPSNAKHWHLKVPQTKTRCHTTFSIRCGGPAVAEVFSDATVSDNGVELQSLNNDNNNTSNMPEMFLYKNAVVTDVGTRCKVYMIGTKNLNQNSSMGGMVERAREMILKNDSSYIFRVTSFFKDNPVSIAINWYEVPVYPDDYPAGGSGGPEE